MLVSIGIPTYNRSRTLALALDSAVSQTHRELEILISDNASSDGTENLCRAAAERDPRVRYMRQPRNLGPTANFNALFAACAGEYVLMLADDDWLDPEYVARCLEVLRADPNAVLVAGRARYLTGGTFVRMGVRHEHRESDPGRRICAYLASVEDNGVFYGVMPRAVLQRAAPLPNVLGNDWMHVARIACQGSVRVLDDVHIQRELGGTSTDVGSILTAFGDTRAWQQRVPQLIIAGHLLRDIAWGPSVYRSLGAVRRWPVAVVAAALSVRWRDLAWHLVTPTLAGLARRRRGRRIWSGYLRVTRALGQGQRH